MKRLVTSASSIFFLVLAISLAHLPNEANASLKDLGPVDNTHGFPVWYRDSSSWPYSTGRPLEICLSEAKSPTGKGPMCPLGQQTVAYDPAKPINFEIDGGGQFIGNFPSEAIYFEARSSIQLSTGATATYRAALQGGFASASGLPEDGKQIVFMRISLKMEVPVPGTYKITHPYGIINITTNDTLVDYVEDLPFLPVAGRFTDALNNPKLPGGSNGIGPFLSGKNVGNINVGGDEFIGDPYVAIPVTGSPFGTNHLLITGPLGSNIGGPGIDAIAALNFTLAGKQYYFPSNLNLSPPPGGYPYDDGFNFRVVVAGSSATRCGTLTVFGEGEPAKPIKITSIATVNSPGYTGETELKVSEPIAPLILNPGYENHKALCLTFTPYLPMGERNVTLVITPDDPSVTGIRLPVSGKVYVPDATVTLAAAVHPPKPSGNLITFQAQGGGPPGPYEYRFWLKSATTALQVVQPYGPSDTWIWNSTGFAPGTYTVQVDMRPAGFTSGRTGFPVERWASAVATVVVTNSVPLATSLSYKQQTDLYGATFFTFTTSASGGNGPLEYRYWIKTGTTWTLMQDYNPSATWVWKPSLAVGVYLAQVDVRYIGSKVREASTVVQIEWKDSDDAIAATITSSKGLGQDGPAPFVPVTFTASAFYQYYDGNKSGRYEYRFWFKSQGAWQLVQQYSTKNSWTWNATGSANGTYYVQADMRRIGSTAEREIVRLHQYTLTGRGPAQITDFSASTTSASVGTPVTFTAGSPDSGNYGYEYRFWLKTGTNWQIVRPYGSSPTWTWDTTGVAPGTYAVQADVRTVWYTGTREDAKVLAVKLQ